MVEESIVFRPEIPERDIKREVRKVNDALEDAGTVSPSMSGGSRLGGGGGGGPRSPLRRISRTTESLEPMADYRNRLLEDILDALQGGGQRGGGGRLLPRLPNLGKLLLGGGGLAVGVAALVASKADVGVGDLIDATATVLPDDLVDAGAEISASAVIASKAAIGAGDVISEGVSVGLDALIGEKASIGAEVLLSTAIASAADLQPQQVLDYIVDPEASGESSGQPSGDSAPESSQSGMSDPLTQALATGGGAVTAGIAAQALGASSLSLPSLGAGGAGGAAAGTMTAATLAPLAAFTGATAATFGVSRRLHEMTDAPEIGTQETRYPDSREDDMSGATVVNMDREQRVSRLRGQFRTASIEEIQANMDQFSGLTGDEFSEITGRDYGSFRDQINTASFSQRQPMTARAGYDPTQRGGGRDSAFGSNVSVSIPVSVDGSSIQEIERQIDRKVERALEDAKREMERDLVPSGRGGR
jgi:hypothetical protein